MPITLPDYRSLRIQDMEGLIATWFLDDPSGQSYSRVINPGANASSYIVPRNIVVDGDMETAGTANWSAGNNATLSKQGSAHSGTQCLRVAYNGTNSANANQTPMTVGKVYTATGWFRGDGTFTATIGNSATALVNSTSSNTWQSFSVTFVCAVNGQLRCISNATSAGYAEFDDIVLTQVNIPAYNSVPTQLLVDGDMEAAGTSAWTVGNSATLSKQTGTPHSGTQVLRIARNGVSSPYAGQTIFTVGNVERAFGYVRSDGSATPTVSNGTTVLFTGTTSTTWQAYDVIFVATATDLRLSTSTNTGTQYVEYDDCTAALDTAIRRDQVLQDNDMEQSGTGYWTAFLPGTTLSKQSASPHSGLQCLRVSTTSAFGRAEQGVLCAGKKYNIKAYARGDGVVGTPQFTNSSTAITDGTGTSSNTWQAFDLTFIAIGNSAISLNNNQSSGYAEFDDIYIYEIDPLSGTPTNGVILGATTGANGHLNTCYSFDGSNDVVNIYSTDLNSMFNPSEGTLIAWVKVSGSGVWTDATARSIVNISVDGSNNNILIERTTVNGQLIFDYSANGTHKQITTTTRSTTWFFVALTWSISNNQVFANLNGINISAPLTSLGTWVGNLASNRCCIGATLNTGSSPFSGFINDVRLYNRALSPAEIYNLYRGAWPFYMNK